jgi:hypothetical protein
MKKIIRLTESDLTRLVKRVLKEQRVKLPATGEDPNYHRYDLGANMPGLEKFLANPLDNTITAELMSELKNDRYKKGKIVIIFNGAKYKEVESFIQKIQADAMRNRCYTITDYNYNNRVLLNTQISITATPGECKKAEPPVQTNPVQTNPVQPKPNPVKEACGVSLEVPGHNDASGIDFRDKDEIKKFQNWCVSKGKGYWMKYLGGERYKGCGTSGDDRPGVWSCCTATCWNQHGDEYRDLYHREGPTPPKRGDVVGGGFVDRMPKYDTPGSYRNSPPVSPEQRRELDKINRGQNYR